MINSHITNYDLESVSLFYYFGFIHVRKAKVSLNRIFPIDVDGLFVTKVGFSSQDIIKDMQQADEFPYGDKYDWNSKVFMGEGSYGKVFKARCLADGSFHAIKQMKMEEFNRDPMLMSSLKGEINITKEVDSEHTVKMFDYHIGKTYTYILLELCDSDLRKKLTEKKFTEEECVKIFEEIMMGFQVIVGKGFIHRDVKPANVLVKANHYKVSDFGFACKADIMCKKKLDDVCGTPIYMAPQLLNNQA